MIKITVAKTDTETIAYTDKKTGKPASFQKQYAYAHTIDGEGNVDFAPEKFEFVPERNEAGQQVPLQRGTYTLHPSSIFVDRNGQLACRLRLTPVTAPKA